MTTSYPPSSPPRRVPAEAHAESRVRKSAMEGRIRMFDEGGVQCPSQRAGLHDHRGTEGTEACHREPQPRTLFHKLMKLTFSVPSVPLWSSSQARCAMEQRDVVQTRAPK